MLKHSAIVAQLATDVETIISALPAALAHLNEWTGEIPSPSTGSTPPPDDEQQPKPAGDHAIRLQLTILARIRLAATAAIDVFTDIDGIRLPADIVHEAHSLAVLRWAVKRLRCTANDVPASKLDNLSRLVAHARSLVVEYQPTRTTAPSGCRLHAAAGDHQPIDDRHRAQSLCRRCGEFRRNHERSDPTPAILRAWSKGIKPTAGQISDAKTAAKKKRKRKRGA